MYPPLYLFPPPSSFPFSHRPRLRPRPRPCPRPCPRHLTSSVPVLVPVLLLSLSAFPFYFRPRPRPRFVPIPVPVLSLNRYLLVHYMMSQKTFYHPAIPSLNQYMYYKHMDIHLLGVGYFQSAFWNSLIFIGWTSKIRAVFTIRVRTKKENTFFQTKNILVSEFFFFYKQFRVSKKNVCPKLSHWLEGILIDVGLWRMVCRGFLLGSPAVASRSSAPRTRPPA